MTEPNEENAALRAELANALRLVWLLLRQAAPNGQVTIPEREIASAPADPMVTQFRDIRLAGITYRAEPPGSD